MPRSTPSLALAAVLGLAATDRAALAQDATEACVDAHVSAQRLRREGKLRETRDALVACSRQACPPVLVRECAAWLPEVEAAMPTIVFEARDAAGRDLVDVRVSLDGRPLLPRLGGSAVEIDPGEHVVRWERAGQRPVEQRIVVREGDKGRRVSTQLDDGGQGVAPAPRPMAATTRPTPTIVYGLGGLGLAGVGVFATLGIVGLSSKGDLDDRNCRPSCATSDVEAVRRTFLAADIALGVGAAALAGAAILWITRPEVPARTSSPAARVRVGVGWRQGAPGAVVAGAL